MNADQVEAIVAVESTSMEVDSAGPTTTIKRKGRGFEAGSADVEVVVSGYESLAAESTSTAAKGNAARSVEGWIVIATNVHEEATEEDVQNTFGDYGEIKNLHLNLERRTGYVKGYALIEYESRAEAEAAIKGASGSQLLEQTLSCDFAFVRPPVGGRTEVKKARGREASPDRKLVTRID